MVFPVIGITLSKALHQVKDQASPFNIKKKKDPEAIQDCFHRVLSHSTATLFTEAGYMLTMARVIQNQTFFPQVNSVPNT